MNFIQKLYYQLIESDNKPLIDKISNLELSNKLLTSTVESLEDSNDSLKESVNKLMDEVNQLTPKIDELEEYWNNKRPKVESKTYPARRISGGKDNVYVDPRVFFNTYNSLPVMTGSNDEKALSAMRYVKNKITYTPDNTQFKFEEEWLFPFETLKLERGDCEDGAILIANILLHSGVPYWRIRLNAGDVKGGGHCWCTYLRESDNQWIILDWCYWYKNDGTVYKDAEDYYNIWFSFNSNYIFTNEVFDRK